MTTKVIDALRYGFSDTDRILIDANVWLYLFGPRAPNSKLAQSYSAVLKNLQKGKAEIYLDVLVLSEFVNRFARDQHKVVAIPGAAISGDFKIFRDSPDFIPIAKAIQASVLTIGRFAKPVDHLLSEFDLPALLTDFAKGARDLNDQLLCETCKKNGMALLSNDADLSRGEITVFTTNPNLLRRKV